ncbi:MAG: MBL fold metallo-hydrolase [Bacteroidota bacterium]|nr:MBL fold metallo-hydrolase [Bacteroidota bacterium]
MKSFIIILFVLLLFNSIPLYSQNSNKSLQITYIANEGFLLKSQTKKVLIDALFNEGYGAFAVPSPETLNNIRDARPPFDSINLYMLSHYHKDHCSSELVYSYLKRNRNIPFVTSKPSLVFINGNCFDFILLKKQFYELTPELNASASKNVNNIPVKAFGLKHLSYYRDSIDMEENMFNTSYLFQMDGINIFHSGDIKINAFKDYIDRNGKWSDPVDVAFLYYGLFDSGTADLAYIIKTINPRYIVFMHVLPKNTEAIAEKVKTLKMQFPNILFLKNSMDSETINL